MVVWPRAREPLESAAKGGGGLGDKAAVATWQNFQLDFVLYLYYLFKLYLSELLWFDVSGTYCFWQWAEVASLIPKLNKF